MSDKSKSYHGLAEKGDGVLVRRGHVWTYPSAETDTSGTNIQMPVEFVNDAEVQDALRSGDLVPVTTHPSNGPMSVRLKGDDAASRPAISVAAAGTAEAGTELPPNSRPTHDAGMKPASAEASQRSAAAAAKQLRAEGGEQRRPSSGDGNRGR